MDANPLRRTACLVVAGAALMSVRISVGQILSNLDANVQAYFTGGTNQFSDPSGLTPWAAAGSGRYPITGVPTVPAPPSSPLYPLVLTPSSSFVSSSTTYFNDTGSVIGAGSIVPQLESGGAFVSDATVKGEFYLSNPTSGYAYQQLDFEADYFVNGALGGVDSVIQPNFQVVGSVTGANAYAQFAGQLNFFWAPTDSSPSHPVLGSWISLGSLDYDWYKNNGANTGILPFDELVNPLVSSSLYSLSATPSGLGILAVIGELFVAGDPAEIYVTSVPEPTSWCLMLAGFGLPAMLYRRRMAQPACD